MQKFAHGSDNVKCISYELERVKERFKQNVYLCVAFCVTTQKDWSRGHSPQRAAPLASTLGRPW